MSEYTTFYLRYQDAPLLEYKDSPSFEELINLSVSERRQLANEINDHNDRVSESLGAKLLCLSTTTSRELSIIPWAESPQVVTINLLEKIMSFYAEEIDECHRYIDSYHNKILVLVESLATANPSIYDKIFSDIDACQDCINFWNEDLERYQYHRHKFEFLMEILKNLNQYYELIYTKY